MGEQSTPTLLVIDDDAAVREVIARVARQLEVQVVVAANALAALQVLHRQGADILISDHSMPGLPGMSFLEHVQERWPAVISVLMTGHATTELLSRAANAPGVHRLMVKPLTIATIRSTIDQCVTEWLARATGNGPPQAVPRSLRSVLIVDDDHSVRAGLRRACEDLGLQVESAAGAAEALGLLELRPFDLLLADLHMPGDDGISLLETARARWPRTVRVLMSGNLGPDQVVAALERGDAAHVLAKPFRASAIRVVMERLGDPSVDGGAAAAG